MPNWCSNSVAFIAEDDKCLPELKKLRNKLIKTSKKQDGKYLFTILEEHGMNTADFNCRGEIQEIGEIQATFVGNMPCFIIGTETAWSPTSEMWDAILEKYEGVFTVYTAEEPGNGIFVNTYDMGYCFTDRYRFESYFDNKEVLNKTNIFGVGRRKKGGCVMSVSYWMNEGLGVALADIIESVDAEKIRIYLKNNDAFESLTEDEYEEWMRDFHQAGNQDRLEMLVEFYRNDAPNLSALFTNSDEKHLLSYGDDGDGKYFLFYPPAYPWERDENECTTEEAARQHVLSAIMQFTFDDTDASEIEKHIDYIYEVGIG